ncbi:hypothetical protein ABFX02_06G010900 [Erythranthe guttata]
MDNIQSENSPSAPAPSHTNGNSDQSTRDLHSSDETSGNIENSPTNNGFPGKKSSNRDNEMLRSSENDGRRRSSRLADNAGGDGTWKEVNYTELDLLLEKSPPTKKHKSGKKDYFFIGEPVHEDEARRLWPWRYDKTEAPQNYRRSLYYETDDDDDDDDEDDNDDDDAIVMNIKCHYSKAEIHKIVFDLGDCAYVKGPEGGPNYVGKILEFFETLDGEDYFRVQWFFRAEDTVIKDDGRSHDNKRLFYSTLMNDNLLDSIVSKVQVVQITPNVNLKATCIPPCDFYFDMKYSLDYSTFNAIADNHADINSLSSLHPPTMSTKNKHGTCKTGTMHTADEMSNKEVCKPELTLLDMYSGCGGMSTGLCLGTKVCGVDLVTRWAVDMDKAACESLKLNHPETQIRHGSAEDFLDLLKEWDSLCRQYGSHEEKELVTRLTEEADEDMQSKEDREKSCEYEVEKIVDIRFSAITKSGNRGLKFKVRWLGYDPTDDTWEPIGALRNCLERIRDFVQQGMKEKILPRPGDVAVICGGPPCQGISGSNRFRNVDTPLDDEKNRQIVIFMDTIDFLKPKFVLMENVVDILRFANGILGRYAVSRLVRMHYQARLGIMAAGCYGLPQFRLRVFLWGAHPHEVLPQFPLPTHDVVIRYGFPNDFERNVVAYDEGQHRDLEKIILLGDAITDLPPVGNDEKRDKISYQNPPETDFQKYIRAAKRDMTGSPSDGTSVGSNPTLYDHLPRTLNDDDYMRVCKVPKRKGANFRDLPGVIIGSDNVVQRAEEHELMPSGKPWVPDYAINLRDGRTRQAFGRLWWDETVPTVFCSPDPHIRPVLHPEQDRVLTIRECARLQGFHDHYMFFGNLKERYSQVGNAVAVSVGRALGYSLGMAVQKLSGENEHLATLPPKFSHSTTVELQPLLHKLKE